MDRAGQERAEEARECAPDQGEAHVAPQQRAQHHLAAESADVADAQHGQAEPGLDAGQQAHHQDGEGEGHAQVERVLPGADAGRGAHGRQETRAEQQHGGDGHQPPGPGVLLREGGDVDPRRVRPAQHLVEQLRHRQPERPLDLAFPGSAEAQGERGPDQVRQAEQEHGEGPVRVPVRGGHHEPDADAEHDVREEQDHGGEGGGPNRRVEADQPGREGRAPRDQQGDEQQAQDPQQPEEEGRGQRRPEADRRGGVEEFADVRDRRVTGGDAEALAGEERGAGEGEQPEHDQRDRLREEFPWSGHGPVVQGAQEERAGREGPCEAHRERERGQARVGLGEDAGPAGHLDRSAGRQHDDRRDHPGERAVRQGGRSRAGQTRRGDGGHHHEGSHDGDEGIAPRPRGAAGYRTR